MRENDARAQFRLLRQSGYHAQPGRRIGGFVAPLERARKDDRLFKQDGSGLQQDLQIWRERCSFGPKERLRPYAPRSAMVVVTGDDKHRARYLPNSGTCLRNDRLRWSRRVEDIPSNGNKCGTVRLRGCGDPRDDCETLGLERRTFYVILHASERLS